MFLKKFTPAVFQSDIHGKMGIGSNLFEETFLKRGNLYPYSSIKKTMSINENNIPTATANMHSDELDDSDDETMLNRITEIASIALSEKVRNLEKIKVEKDLYVQPSMLSCAIAECSPQSSYGIPKSLSHFDGPSVCLSHY